MENIPTFLQYSLHVAVSLKYLLVFLGAIIEGPVLMIACGILLHAGFFNFAPLYTSLVVGDLVSDVAWYYIGYHFAIPFIKKVGKFFGLTPEIFEKVKIIFSKYHTKILFFSKFVMGFGLAIYVLMVAGATRVNFIKYMFLNLIGEFFFVGILLYIGFTFSNMYHYFSSGFQIGLAVFGLIIVILFIYNLQKYFRNKLLKTQ